MRSDDRPRLTREIFLGIGVLLLAVMGGCALPTGASDRLPTELVIGTDGTTKVTSLGVIVEFNAQVLDQRGIEMHNVPLVWMSKDPDILEPVEGARFLAVANGEAIVEVRVDPAHPGVAREGYRIQTVAAATLVLIEQQAGTMTLTPPFTTLWAVGQRGELQLDARDTAGKAVQRAMEVSWSTEDETIATVDAQGVVTAVSDGVVRITAAVEGQRIGTSIKVAARVPVSGCVQSRETPAERCATVNFLIRDS